MSGQDKTGTFWVIDGIKVKKRQPFKVTYVPRIIDLSPEKNGRGCQHANIQINNQLARNFFTEHVYEDIADKGMDYGVIRFSSLS